VNVERVEGKSEGVVDEGTGSQVVAGIGASCDVKGTVTSELGIAVEVETVDVVEVMDAELRDVVVGAGGTGAGGGGGSDVGVSVTYTVVVSSPSRSMMEMTVVGIMTVSGFAVCVTLWVTGGSV
jgi:hypothetical protein